MKGHFVLLPHENVWCQNSKSKNKGAHATLSHTYSVKHAPFLLPWSSITLGKVASFSFSLPMVQCSPFQPGLHSHLPSRHVPCSLQRGWHARWSQAVPIHPSSQRQVPPTQTPCPPQSAAQISVGEERTERRGRGCREGREKKSRVLLLRKAATLHYLSLRGNERNSWSS